MKNYKIIKNHQLMAKINNRRIYQNYLMIQNIAKISKDKTPLNKTEQLREDIIKISNSNIGGMISWNVPYASYQERGMRKDGSHVVRNYTTPGTGKDFAKNAVNKTIKDVNKFFIESLNTIK